MTEDARFDLLAIEVFAWPPFLETTCEVCLLEAAKGKRVAFAFLDVDNYDEFREPAFIRWSFLSGWIYRILHRTRRKKVRAIEQLLRSHGVTVVSPDACVPGGEIPVCSTAGIRSADELRDLRVAGAALGMGTLSSLIFHCQDGAPDIRTCRRFADRLLRSACRSFALATALIQRHAPAHVLLFNGRFACSKGVEQAAILNGATVLYQEAGATCERYYLSEFRPHNVAKKRESIVADWNQAPVGRDEIGAQFFKPGRAGARIMETILCRNRQQRGLTLGSSGRRRVVYFASSVHEYAAVEDGMARSLFPSQHAAVEWLVSWVRARPDTELIIRLHPRMAGLSRRERLWWESCAAENVTVVSPEDRVDSYALAADADRVVCFASSMGPEATYMGRVAISIGDAIYKGLDCVYEPNTIAEFEAMLCKEDLPPKPAQNCLPLGYHRMAFGTPFRVYQPVSYKEGSFEGRPLPRYPDVFSRSVAKALSILHAGMRRCGVPPMKGGEA